MPKKSNGRVTPKKGGPSPAAPADTSGKWELDQSRQVTNPWAWRGMLFLSLIAIGVGIILEGNHDAILGVLWFVVGAGWFGFSMMLWRKHANFIRRG